jgi:hypothetical protein
MGPITAQQFNRIYIFWSHSFVPVSAIMDLKIKDVWKKKEFLENIKVSS